MNLVKSGTLAHLRVTAAASCVNLQVIMVVMPIILFLQVHGDVFPVGLHISPHFLLFTHLLAFLQLLNDHLLLVPNYSLFVFRIQRILSVFAGRSDFKGAFSPCGLLNFHRLFFCFLENWEYFGLQWLAIQLLQHS